MTLWQQNLSRLIARINELMPSEQPANGMFLEYEEFRAHQRKLDAVVKQLVDEEGGRHSRSNGAEVLRLAGLQTSCTTGPAGLLRNWQSAALRKIASARGDAARRPSPHSTDAGLRGGLGRDEIDDDCPGHVACEADAKVCGRCGTHIDDLRPDDNDPRED